MRSVVRLLCVLMAVFLAGCSINRVKFSEPLPLESSSYRQINAVQSMCELPDRLALFVDARANLWVNCPYRYEGKVVQSLAHIGPKSTEGETNFAYDSALTKAKTLRSLGLKKCAGHKYCADLSAYGYLDFEIVHQGSRASISYIDASGGVKDVERFYAAIQGRDEKFVLQRNLNRLVDAAKITALISQVGDLIELASVERILSSAGLLESPGVRFALDSRRRPLRVTAFRQKNSFEGFQSAYALSGESTDLSRMRVLAQSPAEKTVVFAALIQDYKFSKNDDALASAMGFITTKQEQAQYDELRKVQLQERQAEARRQEESRLAERRRKGEQQQAEARRLEQRRLEEQQAAQAREAEARCMRDAACRQVVEQRQAQCVEKIKSCRKACDNVTGAGAQSSFFGGLVASGLARACYSACKCEAGAGDLIEKFDRATKKGG